MGYTHYWTYDPKSEEFQKGLLMLLPDAKLIIDRAEARGIYVRGKAGANPVTEGGIWFNGAAPPCVRDQEKYEHETFVMESSHPWLYAQESEWDEWLKEGYDTNGHHFVFCKTARKPYDLVVGAILLRANHLFGLDVSSDGNWDTADEWGVIRDFYREVFGEDAEAPRSMCPDPHRLPEVAL